MLKKNLRSALALLLALLLSTPSYAAGTITFPQDVTPVKSWTVVVGTTYKIPNDVKQAGDSYASSNTAIVPVNSSTGQFTPQAAGVAYIVATNGGQSRYFKVTSSNTAATTTANLGALDGFPVSVLNTTTPAVTVRYYAINNTFANYFASADGTVLGSISQDTYVTILQSAMDNGILGVDDSGSAWMAEQFNLYRGINFGQSDIASATAVDTDAYAQEIIRLVNEKRENVGLHVLEVDDSLMEHARIRAEEVSSNFSHVRPDGTVETSECATGVGTTPAAAFQSWMNSEPHRRAILNETGEYKYNYIGAGCYRDNGGSFYWIITFSK